MAPALWLLAQLLALAAALALLILLPAQLSGRLAGVRAWQAWASFWLYLAFFGSGTLGRMARHGRLAPRAADAQRGTARARLALLAFAAGAVPAGHWAAWWDGSLASLGGQAGGLLRPLLLALGWALMLGGWALNAAAAAELGKGFDRLTTPNRLVTRGPYAWVQHPLYSSYTALFAGHCLSLGSPCAACALLAACLAYYSQRTRIEEGLLVAAFGERYERYRRATGRFLPRLRAAPRGGA